MNPIAVQITIRVFRIRARLMPAADPRLTALVTAAVPASSTPSHIGLRRHEIVLTQPHVRIWSAVAWRTVVNRA
jgi:hypothetical protein